MNELEKYEESMKQKLDAVEFPFNEENWQDFESKYYPKEKHKKGGIWMISVFCLMLILTMTYFIYNQYINSSFSEKTTTSKKNQKNSNGFNNAVLNSIEDKQSNASELAINETKRVKKENAENKAVGNKTEQENESEIKYSDDTSNQKKHSQKHDKKIKVKSSEVEMNPVNIYENYKRHGIITNAKKNQYNNNLNSKPETTEEENKSLKEKSESVTYQDEIPLLENINDTIFKSDSLQSIIQIDSVYHDVLAGIKDTIHQSNQSYLVAQSLRDSLNVSFNKYLLDINIGLDYLMGWGQSHKDASGINPTVAISITRWMMKSRLGINLGVGYQSVSHLTQSTYSVSSPRYSFGVSNQYTQIQYKNLDYISIPIYVILNINTKNQVGFGVQTAYLINAAGKMNSYEVTDLKPEVQQNYQSSKINGYNGAFNPFDLSAQIFYTRRFNNRLKWSCGFMYGLTDTKLNKKFNENKVERNSGIKLTVGYDLFKK